MNILEIETLLGRLQKTQISLIEILKQDDDFCALTELQYRENAAIPFVVSRGAKLRTILDRKYGGRPTSGTMFKLGNALTEIEQTLNAVTSANLLPTVERQIAAPVEEKASPADEKAAPLDQKTEEVLAQIADAVSDEPADVTDATDAHAKISDGKMNIAEQAADRAVALAKLRDLKFARSEADIIAVGAPSVEDIQRLNIAKNAADVSDISVDEPETDLVETVQIEDEPSIVNIAAPDMHYFPTSSALAQMGRGIAFAVVAVITIVTISSTHPEQAKASMDMFHSLYSAALTCCNIEVSAANLR